MSKIILQEYNWDTKETVQVGETSTYTLVRSMNIDDFCQFLDDFINSGGKDYRDGIAVGTKLMSTHRTLQGCLIRFCLGVIVAFAKQDYTDARNEKPVAMARKIAELVKDGTLDMGWMI